MDRPLPVPPSAIRVRSIGDGELRDKFNRSGLIGRWKKGLGYPDPKGLLDHGEWFHIGFMERGE